MKLLWVANLSRYARAVYTVIKYLEAGRALGHEVAVFGEKTNELPDLPWTVDVKGFDYVVVVLYDVGDFPGLPYLAYLLDGVPKERRVVIDCYGRLNDTIRVEHDFNHLEKLDGHQGWEWVEAIQALSDKVLQPTLRPHRPDARPFLFHAFDPAAVVRPYDSPQDAARAWSGAAKPAGMVYVGNNWQRWSQLRPLLEALRPVLPELGPTWLAGWDWDERPAWAAQLGIQGVDVDPELLRGLGVEVRPGVPFDKVTEFVSQGRLSPVIHRPLFNELGLVTNRTFETFAADVLPLLLIPEEVAYRVYGEQARPLLAGADVAGRTRDMLRRPEPYWDAVLRTRAHLAERHSFRQRFRELLTILKS
jgi:hypothetical protein